MKRLTIAAAVLLLSALVVVATPLRAPAATPFRVVAVGDSICTAVCPSIVAPAYHYDAEPGRGPYNTGAENRATTVQAIGALTRTVANSSNNWVVVFDGGTGTHDGTYITNAEWTNYVNDVLRLTAGKCLLFVYPGYGHTVNGVADETGNDIAYARTVIAAGIFAQNTHRCIRTVNWWAVADANPSYLLADGLHPSPAGVGWLLGQVNGILPN